MMPQPSEFLDSNQSPRSGLILRGVSPEHLICPIKPMESILRPALNDRAADTLPTESLCVTAPIPLAIEVIPAAVFLRGEIFLAAEGTVAFSAAG